MKSRRQKDDERRGERRTFNGRRVAIPKRQASGPTIRSTKQRGALGGHAVHRGGRSQKHAFCETNPPVNYRFYKYLGVWPLESGRVGSGRIGSIKDRQTTLPLWGEKSRGRMRTCWLLKGRCCHGRWLPQITAASRLTRLDKLSMTNGERYWRVWTAANTGATERTAINNRGCRRRRQGRLRHQDQPTRQVAGGECFLTNCNFHGPLTRIVVSHIVRTT